MLLLLFGCGSQVVEIEIPPHTPRLAVTAFYGDFKTSEIFVGSSVSILSETDASLVDNARIKLYVNEEVIASDYQRFTDAYYHLFPIDFDETGANYRLEVESDDFPTATAYQTLLPKPQITNSSFDDKLRLDLKRTFHYEIDIEFQDASQQNYYHVQAYIVKKHDLSEFYPIWTWSDQFLFTQESRIDYGLFFDDNDFNDQVLNVTLKIEAQYINFQDDFVAVKLSSISEDYYQFLRTFNDYERAKEDPFSESVILHSNIENGDGIFSIESGEMYIVK